MPSDTTHLIAGPAGTLELLEQLPDDAQRPAVAIVCHPHPQHGGTLNNKVVHQLARSFNRLGAVAIRFNFRGVGRSEGAFDNGDGELLDLLAVLEWANERWPGRQLWLGGFSFGGFIALKAAATLHPEWLVTVAPAVQYLDEDIRLPEMRWLLIQGSEDDVVPARQVTDWCKTLMHSPDIALIEGAGHFFHGRLNDLQTQVIGRFQDR